MNDPTDKIHKTTIATKSSPPSSAAKAININKTQAIADRNDDDINISCKDASTGTAPKAPVATVSVGTSTSDVDSLSGTTSIPLTILAGNNNSSRNNGNNNRDWLILLVTQ